MNKRSIRIFSEILLLLAISFSPESIGLASSPAIVPESNAYDLIAAVNGLRTSRGLPAYRSNSILMQIAQAQADYLASTNGANGHIGPGGTHPIDRAIAAGYPVSGGFISENWVSGSNLTAQGAINYWMGDAPHQLTMLSSDLQDIGAGVGQSGDYYYYVIDCGLARGSSPSSIISTSSIGVATISVSGTPVTQEATIPAAIISTPDEKGNIYHIVQPGQTLWQIAIAYHTTVNKLQNSNNLSSADIMAGQKLFISFVGTATPIPPTSTQTRVLASSTPVPTFVFFTSTPTTTPDPIPAAPKQGPTGAGTEVFAIILVALSAAGLVAWFGRSRTI
jgi:LysM repeat protein